MSDGDPDDYIENDNQDICGLCGEPGADKLAHPMYWPGEQRPDSQLVHAECEAEECQRAHAQFYEKVGDRGVSEFLRNIK